MKVRLLIPECRNWDKDEDGRKTYICSDSYRNIDERTEMLQCSMVFKNKMDLVVTSHNFFSFPIDNSVTQNCYKNSDCFRQRFIEPKIIELLNKKVECKKPLIIGFDLLASAKAKKSSIKSEKKGKSKKSINQESNPNPYGGIPAVVLYLKVKNNEYVYGTHIWECWRAPRSCNSQCFSAQNRNRVINFRKRKIGLLSCGDIAEYCHNNGQLLPKVDIYVDLSHRSLNYRSSQFNKPHSMIGRRNHDYNACNFVLITHQVTRNTIRRYCRDNYYLWVFPNRRYPRISTRETTRHQVESFEINRNMAGLVDVEIP